MPCGFGGLDLELGSTVPASWPGLPSFLPVLDRSPETLEVFAPETPENATIPKPSTLKSGTKASIPWTKRSGCKQAVIGAGVWKGP